MYKYLFLFCFILTSCNEKLEKPIDYEAFRRKEPLTESYNVTYIFTEKGVVKAKLKGKRVFEDYRTEGGEVITRIDGGLIIEFFDSTGKPDTKLQAQKGVLYEKRNYADANEEVIIINAKNEKLETESLRWNRATNRITSNSAVKISTENEIVYGDSLDANINFSVYKIFKTRGAIQLKDE